MKALLNGDRFEHFTDKELDDMEKIFRENNINLLNEVLTEKLSRAEASEEYSEEK